MSDKPSQPVAPVSRPSVRPRFATLHHFSSALFYILVGVTLFMGLHFSWPYLRPYVPQEHEQLFKILYDAIYLVTGITVSWLYLGHRQKFIEHQNSEERLRLFIKHTPVAVAMLDKNMRYLEASDRWISDFRLDGDALIGRSHYDAFSFISMTDELRDMHKRCLQGETIRRRDVCFTGAHGQTEWSNYEMTPWRHANGTIGGLIFFSEIITEKKEAETRLQDSEARFIRAMNGSRDILWDWTIATNEIYFHPRLRQLLGYSEAEFSSHFNEWKKLIHPTDYPVVKQKLQDHIESSDHPYKVECRMRGKSGQYIWFEARGQAERDTRGKLVRMSGFLTDISEKKHLENIKKEFVYVVTHELRTPLTALKGAIDMLPILLGKDIPTRVENMLDLAMQGSERLMLLIDDLLTAGEIESETMRFDIRPETLSSLLERAMQTTTTYADKYGVGVTLDDRSDNVTIRVDGHRFSQVMSNLLSNAIKFSPKGDNVHVTALRDDETVRITVTDHGSGIPDAFRNRIFQKFAQHDKSKPGTGLGLNITKTMVERMNGTIGFDSEEGKGTSFYIEFPIA